MTVPNINQLITYTNDPIDDIDYKFNWDQVIKWLTNGEYDLTVNSLSAQTLNANQIGHANTIYFGKIGGIAGADIFPNGTFEENIIPWETYNNGAVAQPTTGSGGVADISFTRDTSAPLFGVASGLISKPATDCQGQGISCDFVLPIGWSQDYVTISLYGLSAGTYSSSDIGVYIYDIDNTTLIDVSPNSINSGLNNFQGQFLATTSLNYRLILHIQTTNSSAYTIKLDNVSVYDTIAPVDSIGTVQLAENAGNISTTFTKNSNQTLLRFEWSGAVLGNATGTIVLSIGGNTVRTITTQGPAATLAASASGGGTTAAMATSNVFNGANSGAYWSNIGAIGTSGSGVGWAVFDITTEANGSLAYAVTFTNFTQPSAAVYVNRTS